MRAREGRAPASPSTSYDEVPYESTSFRQTHPDRLATLGRLFGLSPAPVEGCRVLELGCAMGANLLPMAFRLPGSEFVGVDASGRQVSEACRVAAALGLDNVRMEHASILDVDADWGTFDYVVCHGVFSWVPEVVQEKILAIAAENLRPHGVAYVSYNTYPGWHVREAVRHMMRYHAGRFADIPERIGQARALLEFLAAHVDGESYYGSALRSELELVNEVQDSYLFHDHLEEINTPLYFHEFVTRATRHGLSYLAEADFSSMLTSGFPEGTAETLDRISPDLVHAEQYMDFLRNRFFRRTLLCHGRHPLDRRLTGSALEGFLLASPVSPGETEDGDGPGFEMPDGRWVTAAYPPTRAALDVLGEHWPRALDQETLRELAWERLDADGGGEPADGAWDVVRKDLLHCYSKGAVDLHTWQAPFVTDVSERPAVSRLVAEQAAWGSGVSNERHEAVTLDGLGRRLATILDGTRDRDALLSELMACVARGELTVEDEGRDVTDEAEARRIVRKALDRALASFARGALLVR